MTARPEHPRLQQGRDIARLEAENARLRSELARMHEFLKREAGRCSGL